MSVGIGYDIHKISEEGEMVLGGIKIKSMPSFNAESDGDVIIHALIDAILGASNKMLENNEDISDYFHTNNGEKDQNSQKVLKKIIDIIENTKKLSIINIDIVVIAKKPTIKDHKEMISANLAKMMNIDMNQISIKGKSNNTIGDTGNGSAVACMVIIQLND